MTQTLPYKLAVLCYLYDDDDHLLLIHRKQNPNAGMYSPIGGKVETTRGESPHECAIREIKEEAGLSISPEFIRLTGIVTERAYEGETHWLIFLFEVTRTIRQNEIKQMTIAEGNLQWVPIDHVAKLPIPQTDRQLMWPLVQSHRDGFFMIHIDCTVGGPMTWTVTESVNSSEPATVQGD